MGAGKDARWHATVLSDNAWNADGTLQSRADGDGGAIGTSAYAYDWADRLLSVDLPDTFSTAVPSFAWRADGLLGSRKWSSSTAAIVAYDKARRPVSITKGTLSFGQAYDRDGNVTAESRSLPGVSGNPGTGSQSFSYDALNRVTGSSGLASDSRSYTYDLDGNRLTETVNGATKTSTYDRTDQLVNVGGGGSPTAYAYDQYGNLTGNAESVSAVTALTYDAGDKLTGIDATGTANDATFTFDAFGRFKTRAISGSTDTYSYAGASETVLRIANSTGTTTDSIVSPVRRPARDQAGGDAQLAPARPPRQRRRGPGRDRDDDRQRDPLRPLRPVARDRLGAAGPRSAQASGSSRAGSTSARRA